MRKLDKEHLKEFTETIKAILEILGNISLWIFGIGTVIFAPYFVGKYWNFIHIPLSSFVDQTAPVFWGIGIINILVLVSILLGITLVVILIYALWSFFDWLFPRVTSDKNKEDGKE